MNFAAHSATLVRAATLATPALLAAVLLAAELPAVAADAATWKGVKVFPKVGAQIKVDHVTTYFGRAQVSFPWIVQDVKGELLLVGKQRKGWIEKDQVVTLDEAPAYYSQFTRLYGYETWAYEMRAFVLQEKGDLLRAIADYQVAIRLGPTTWNYMSRGRAWDTKKDHGKALADFNQAIRIDPHFALGYNNAAWLKTTCSQERFRNGTEAVELATKACELTGWEDSSYLDTLAAAYAEKGDFEPAIKYQNKALELNPTDAELRQHAELFKNHQPCRE